MREKANAERAPAVAAQNDVPSPGSAALSHGVDTASLRNGFSDAGKSFADGHSTH